VNKKTEMVEKDTTTIMEAGHEVTPMIMMQMAVQQGAPVEQMERLWELNEKVEAANARKAFYAALAEFKKNPPQVAKDKLNNQYGSNYVSIGQMVNTVSQHLGVSGLSTSWEFGEGQNGEIVCTCVMSHKLGHQESVTLSSPIDVSGKKNPLQGRKSTRTYLKLETFEAVTGMASVEGNVDDDGNSAFIEPEQEQTLLPVYPDEKFQDNIDVWKGRFKEGSSNPEHIINMIGAKYTLTEEQIKQIKEGE